MERKVGRKRGSNNALHKMLISYNQRKERRIGGKIIGNLILIVREEGKKEHYTY